MIIGLLGAKGAGKTTIFNLMRELDPSLNEITLAAKLKDVCSQTLKIDRELFDCPIRKEEKFSEGRCLNVIPLVEIFEAYELEPSFECLGRHVYSAREAAQIVGTEVLRARDPDIHLKWAARDMNPAKNYVVTDIRFPNELEYFANRGNIFKSVYINRRAAEAAASYDKHPSESHLETLKRNSMFVIDNNGSLEDARKQVEALYRLAFHH